MYNEDINMMSVSPAIHNPYAVNERLELQPISSVWELFEASFSAAGIRGKPDRREDLK